MNDGNLVTQPGSRRDFAKKFLTGLASAVLGLIPFGAGFMVFLDPLRRRSSEAGVVHVTSLEALPADGIPRKFTILATRIDAWNRFSQVPIGAVYLRRTTESDVQAFN